MHCVAAGICPVICTLQNAQQRSLVWAMHVLPRSWCKAKGMMSRVSPAMFGNLRGAAADEDIRPGDVLVSLPTACLISYDTALTSDLVRASGWPLLN